MDTLLQVYAAVLPPLLVGLVSIGLAFLNKRLHLQADSTAAQLDATANAAIQGAVANFAGSVSGALADGSLTTANAVAKLQGYLIQSVDQSVARMAPSPEVLSTILLGKLAALAGVVVSPAVETARMAEVATPAAVAVARERGGSLGGVFATFVLAAVGLTACTPARMAQPVPAQVTRDVGTALASYQAALGVAQVALRGNPALLGRVNVLAVQAAPFVAAAEQGTTMAETAPSLSILAAELLVTVAPYIVAVPAPSVAR